MMRKACILLVTVLISLVGVDAALAASPAEDLKQLFADHWEFTLREFPTFATETGDHRYDDRLSSVGLADQARRTEETRRFLARLHAIDRAGFSDEDRVNYGVFERLREDEVRDFELKTHFMPITNNGGFYTEFPQLPDRLLFPTTKSYEDYISRLRAFKKYAEQHIELMRQGIREGFVLPKVALVGWEDQVKPHLVDDPTKSLLFRPFEKFADTVPAAERERLVNAGREAIATSVLPGYREFYDFMAKEYAPAGRETIAATALPNGKEYYQQCIREHTTLDRTAEEIHTLGVAENQKIRAEMDAIIQLVGFKGTFPEFLEFLRSDPRLYPKTSEELLQRTAWVCKRMDGELPRLFKTLPRQPYTIKPVPDYLAPKIYPAYAEPGTADNTVPGIYRVNLYNLKDHPLYQLEALSFHESVPGHLLQIARAQELTNLPNFRRFSGFTAYVEGWALYCELLGKEVGFYTDPYSDFGRLTYAAWRASRLVVDTGIHALGWSRQQAIDYMAQNTSLPLHTIETEVDRYISWPGQALAYKMGEMKIRELRARAETELGERFDRREFHNVLLDGGPLPLDVLDGVVNRWIGETKKSAR